DDPGRHGVDGDPARPEEIERRRERDDRDGVSRRERPIVGLEPPPAEIIVRVSEEELWPRAPENGLEDVDDNPRGRDRDEDEAGQIGPGAELVAAFGKA